MARVVSAVGGIELARRDRPLSQSENRLRVGDPGAPDSLEVRGPESDSDCDRNLGFGGTDESDGGMSVNVTQVTRRMH